MTHKVMMQDFLLLVQKTRFAYQGKIEHSLDFKMWTAKQRW